MIISKIFAIIVSCFYSYNATFSNFSFGFLLKTFLYSLSLLLTVQPLSHCTSYILLFNHYHCTPFILLFNHYHCTSYILLFNLYSTVQSLFYCSTIILLFIHYHIPYLYSTFEHSFYHFERLMGHTQFKTVNVQVPLVIPFFSFVW